MEEQPDDFTIIYCDRRIYLLNILMKYHFIKEV